MAVAVTVVDEERIHLTLDKNLEAGGRGEGYGKGSRISIEVELSTKDIDGLFKALEQARMENVEF